MRTWRVLDQFEGDGELELNCPNCGQPAVVPTHGRAQVIASIGLALITDPPGQAPPPGFMPVAIQCRRCLSIYAKDGYVRKAV